MKKTILTSLWMLTFCSHTNAQNEKKDTSLQISGSADIYYKYDFANGYNNQAPENVVLGTKQNSIDFGLFDLRIKKQIGDAAIFSELTFGSRPYYNLVDPQLAYNIQNLYMSYQMAKNLSFTAGVMYRYQTYEKMTPADNFHYAMSFSFLNQYFNRSAGIKAAIQITPKTKLVAGLYNSYDPKGASNPTVASPIYGLSDFCSQLFVTPTDKFKASAAIWREGQRENGLHRNFQAEYQLSKNCKFGLDATKYTCTDSITANHSYQSAVGYVQLELKDFLSFGTRYEYLERVETPNAYSTEWSRGYYSILTFTSSFHKGPLTFKQELKFDNTNKSNLKSIYLNSVGEMTHHASQIVFAATYKF